MTPLGDYIGEQLRLALPAPRQEQPEGPESRALVAMQDVVPDKEAKAIATALVEYAASQDFSNAVNRAVPPPDAKETEKQFVHRAKEAIRSVLLRKFGR